MRHKFLGLAMAAVATLGPVQAFGGDREIAQSIYGRLQKSRDAGQLKDFSLDMKVDEGVVLFRGKVVGDQQRAIVLESSKGIEGVLKVIDELKIEQIAKIAQSKPAKLYRPAKKSVAVQPTAKAADSVAATETKTDSFDFAQALASPADQSATQGMTIPEPVVVPEPVVPEALVHASQSKADAISKTPGMMMPESVVVPAPFVPEALAQNNQPDAQAVAAIQVATNHRVQEVVPGIVQPASALEGADSPRNQSVPVSSVEPVTDDAALTNLVVRAINRAKSEGHVKNFGLDVNSYDGMIQLEGTASSVQQREFLGNIARHAPGARGVRNLIEVKKRPATPTKTVSHRSPAPTPAPTLQPLPQGNQPRMSAPPTQAMAQQQPMIQHRAMAQQHPMQSTGRSLVARPASHGQSYGGHQIINGEQVVPGSMITHGGDGGSYGMGMGSPVGGQISGAPVMGTPVPMAPSAPAGAPRYDSPNLPNYAWPGYAAHPNYAALSYPQQYSPSAFPYIGPFYPYPQVPMGWRKVSLEWDDGWWFLDFTDK